MRRLILALIFASPLTASADIWTNLGELGNLALLAKYQNYTQKKSICPTNVNQSKRLILTGYGPFMGGQKNFSELVVKHLGDLPSPNTNDDVYGAVKTMNLNGESVAVCFLVFDVVWDLAGAILVNEMRAFQPDAIIMTGLGAKVAGFETGALNSATAIEGYDINGNPIKNTTPIAQYVLPPNDPGVNETVAMTWDATKMFEASEQEIKALGYIPKIEPFARPENDYLCNNISYLALSAAKGINLRLFGEMLDLKISIQKSPKIGFFHYPSAVSLDPNSIAAWSKVMTTMLAAALE